jgi:hypothetical protein
VLLVVGITGPTTVGRSASPRATPAKSEMQTLVSCNRARAAEGNSSPVDDEDFRLQPDPAFAVAIVGGAFASLNKPTDLKSDWDC